MGGRISQGQRSHEGSEDQSHMRDVDGILLPIFGKNFEGHRVQNWYRHAGPKGFAGESKEGWGVHADGVVDCLDMRRVLNLKLGLDPDNWQYLWNLESTIEENGMLGGDGRTHLIRRLVIPIQLIFSGSVFIPDSKAWAVFVPSPRWDISGGQGFVVPKPATDPKGAEARFKRMRRRARRLSKCK